MSKMYNFIFNMWKLGRYTTEQINTCVLKEYITQEEASEIINNN